jgi:hypothetical protein
MTFVLIPCDPELGDPVLGEAVSKYSKSCTQCTINLRVVRNLNSFSTEAESNKALI